MESIKEKEKKIFQTLKGGSGLGNPHSAARLVKVVVNSGTGSSRKDKTKKEIVQDRLMKITGQKALPTQAKKSIASFKLREGEPIGYKVTLRGKRMYDFLNRFFHIAVPRIRDFRGFSPSMVDAAGNLTIGVREHNIFPETAIEDVKNIFGLSVTMVTTARNREEALKFFESLGVPFKKK